ncbi:MAG: addiction module protein [Chitinophagales bacterium]|nr:addiction module protein [Chitinophagales bacterium]
MQLIEEILKLNTADKILLIEKVWDRISPEKKPVPETHLIETRRGIEAIKNGEVSLSSWEEVRNRIHSQL